MMFIVRERSIGKFVCEAVRNAKSLHDLVTRKIKHCNKSPIPTGRKPLMKNGFLRKANYRR
ncbi:hypothetical protein VCRLGP8_1430090 [Vibrio crassostreae]|nr:hypothetical protein VCRLGP8_1430090 [Vibrio crassostreae]